MTSSAAAPSASPSAATSTAAPSPAAPATPSAARAVPLRYARTSDVPFDGARSEIRLALDSARAASSSATTSTTTTTAAAAPSLAGRVTDPVLFRDALATLLAVQSSDLRYQGKDRSAYFAYLLAKGKRAGAGVWEAQKAFIDRELTGETAAATGLDPVFTVDADEASLEVFSRDESAYARLALHHGLLEGRRATPGTTFFQVPPAFPERIGRLRSYLPVDLDASSAPAPSAAASAPGAATSLAPAAPATERTASVTEGWLKSFLQVQSAATLPATTCEIAPVDLYNILYVLTVRRAKKAPRALRFELVPGARPRIVLEPWGVVLEAHGAPFTGRTPAVIRTYGRQRLLTLARLLPHVRRARIALLGPGLPVFWTFDLGGDTAPLATLTLALTGWTDSSWSSAAAFDRLVPSPSASALADKAIAALTASGPLSLPALAAALKSPPEAARAAVQRACLRGEVLFDIASATFRRRSLFATPVDDDVTRAATPREARALRFLETKGAIAVTKEHAIAGTGLEVRGEAKDAEARRTYAPRFTLDLEGRVTDAWCNCPTFARSGLREGPCEHMLALRTAHAREREAALRLRDTPEGRARIRAETRTLVRRDDRGAEETCRISLDGKRVRIAWTAAGGAVRHQALDFDRESDARDEHFSRLEALAGKGFIDAGDMADAGGADSPSS